MSPKRRIGVWLYRIAAQLIHANLKEEPKLPMCLTWVGLTCTNVNEKEIRFDGPFGDTQIYTNDGVVVSKAATLRKSFLLCSARSLFGGSDEYEVVEPAVLCKGYWYAILLVSIDGEYHAGMSVVPIRGSVRVPRGKHEVQVFAVKQDGEQRKLKKTPEVGVAWKGGVASTKLYL